MTRFAYAVLACAAYLFAPLAWGQAPLSLHAADYQTAKAALHPHPAYIIISTREKRLYFYPRDTDRAVVYPIGVGRVGFTWGGKTSISAKKEWPSWTPPSQMIARQPYLPRYVAGGPGNPLGSRALYLGASEYRIHGTSEPDTIGKQVSSGCFRMLNRDVEQLYSLVEVGTPVTVLQ